MACASAALTLAGDIRHVSWADAISLRLNYNYCYNY
jgi:hypothetical protein